MKTVDQILRQFDIPPEKRRGRNKFYTTCPRCSPGRKKKKSPCLRVLIKPDGVVFFCIHCEHHGGTYFDDDKNTRTFRREGARAARPQPRERRSIGHLYR